MKTILQEISSLASTSFCLNVFLFSQHVCLLSHFEIIGCTVKSLIATLNTTEKQKLKMYYLQARVWAPKPVYWSLKLPEYVPAL